MQCLRSWMRHHSSFPFHVFILSSLLLRSDIKNSKWNQKETFRGSERMSIINTTVTIDMDQSLTFPSFVVEDLILDSLEWWMSAPFGWIYSRSQLSLFEKLDNHLVKSFQSIRSRLMIVSNDSMSLKQRFYQKKDDKLTSLITIDLIGAFDSADHSS